MGANSLFNAGAWEAVPFHFWSVMFFVLGCIVGSFLNVCIHRLPLGISIVSPPSHCPHCRYAIPAYLNIPLVTWLVLWGRCKNCGARISFRYFLVELLTGVAFLASWWKFGDPANPLPSLPLALVFAAFLAGLIVATFIDFEHFIIPDEITFGGMVLGFAVSFFLPALQGTASLGEAMFRSALGVAVGAGIVYAILRLGKLLFGRKHEQLEPGAKVIFTETTLCLGRTGSPQSQTDSHAFDFIPGRILRELLAKLARIYQRASRWLRAAPGRTEEREIPYEEILYRQSDTIVLFARRVEMVDRCYQNVTIRLSRTLLEIGPEKMDPADVHYLEAECDEIVLPQEAMGLGDVKFMGGIGAFIGWQGVLFSLMVSSLIGAVVGITLIGLRRREWSSRMPYGPYIALAAVLWVFAGARLVSLLFPPPVFPAN